MTEFFKNLEMNLAKGTKDLYTANYKKKQLLKENK